MSELARNKAAEQEALAGLMNEGAIREMIREACDAVEAKTNELIEEDKNLKNIRF